ncbi:MAG: RNA methyltransferase [Hyphomicrobiales bacterium]|nr:RNA methyltransferase [Rickettsiales bacterium]MCP5361673.1 RNA methyltransferase [Hyphomicrobiales bacterium]
MSKAAQTPPAVILVRPQMGENIGAAARVMANFGCTDLRIVAPRDGWPNPKAEEMAAGTLEKIAVSLWDDVPSAVADLQLVWATTARTRDMTKPEMAPKACWEMQHPGLRTGILFGPERSGLTNDEVALADVAMKIPVSQVFTSLNLAQAVAVACYGWYETYGEEEGQCIEKEVEMATKAEVVAMLEHLEQELDRSGFYDAVPDKQPRMQRNIRNIFTRATLTKQEVQTLRGVIRSLAERRKAGP